MIVAKFSNEDYLLVNEDDEDSIIIRETTPHEALFEYERKDLSALPDLLYNYISKLMDLSTLELTGEQASKKDIDEIYDVLEKFHPFYKLDRIDDNRDVLLDAIGDYFNFLLVQKEFKDNIKEKFDYNKYKKILNILTDESLNCKSYYKHYKRLKKVYDPIRFNFTGFDSELDTQYRIQRMLFWILDITSESINKLDVKQREWLYGNTYGIADSGVREYEFSVKKRLLFNIQYKNAKSEISDNELRELTDQRNKTIKQYDTIYDICNTDSFITNQSQKAVEEFIDEAVYFIPDDLEEEKYNDIYEVTDLYDVLFLEVTKMINQGKKIRRCGNCNMYFVVTNLNQNYCNRIIDGQACAKVGPSASLQRKKDNVPALEAYLRANNTRRMRITNGIMMPEELEPWREEAQKKLEQVNNGELDIEEYKKWLKKKPDESP